MDRKIVEQTLELIRNIKGTSEFYDVHVHPFEVMDGAINYVTSSSCCGLYSSVSAEYAMPELADLDLRKKKPLADRCRDKNILNKMLQLNRRRIYAHNGPKVFSDQMKLSVVDKVVLLPVMGKDEFGDQQLQLLSAMFGGDDRFLTGYCVPNGIPVDKITENTRQVVNEYNIKVLKIHPSLQGIDLSGAEGKDRIESMLAASREEHLKVVVHGGLSPDCKDSQAVAYSTVNNLQLIDWSITPETVVIAHSGAYGQSPEEVNKEVLPSLRRLLSRYPNLVVDTSALEVDSLSLIFRNINTDRICFGSDSLYEKQWVAMIKMWCALQQSFSNPEEALLKVASENPGKLFSGEDEGALENIETVELNR